MSWPTWLRVDAWLLGRLLRERSVGVAALGLAAVWVAAQGLAGIGITGPFARHGGPLYELAFVAVALAAGLGCWVLGQHPWLWHPLDRIQRATAEAAFLVAAGALALGLAWLPALASGQALPWAAAGAAVLHVAALAQLVSRFPAPLELRPLLLWSLVWWIPALLRGAPEPAGWLAGFLAGPIDLLTQSGIQTRSLAPVDGAPTVACALAAWLLTPDTPRS